MAKYRWARLAVAGSAVVVAGLLVPGAVGARPAPAAPAAAAARRGF